MRKKTVRSSSEPQRKTEESEKGQRTEPNTSEAASILLGLQGLIGNQALTRAMRTDPDDSEEPASEPIPGREKAFSRKETPRRSDGQFKQTFLLRPNGSNGTAERTQARLSKAFKSKLLLAAGHKDKPKVGKLLGDAVRSVPISRYSGFDIKVKADDSDKDQLIQTFTGPSGDLQYKAAAEGEGARLNIEVTGKEPPRSEDQRHQASEIWVANRIPRLSTQLWSDLSHWLEELEKDQSAALQKPSTTEEFEEELPAPAPLDEEE